MRGMKHGAGRLSSAEKRVCAREFGLAKRELGAMEGALRGTVEALAREAPAKAAWVAWAAEERLSRSLATTVELSDGGQDNAMKMLMILTMSILGVIVLLFALCGAG